MDNKKIEEQYGKKIESDNIFTDLYYDAVDIMNDTVKPFISRSFKTAGECMKLKNMKLIYKTKEKYFYLASLPLSGFLIYKLDVKTGLSPKFYVFSLFGYFLYKGFYLELFPDLKPILLATHTPIKKGQSFLDKKDDISNLFNGNVIVTGCTDYTITLKSAIPCEEIKKKASHIEILLNYKVESVIRNPNNFKIITITLESKKKFKKSYPLSQYIKTTNKKGKIPFMLGVDKKENPQTADLSKIHHMLISGDSGGGKTTCMNSTIQSMMYFNNNILYMFIDFKLVGFNVYRKFPNSIFVDSHEMFFKYLKILKKEMEKRYRRFANVELEDIWQYNNMFKKDPIPIIVAYIDEIADIRLNADEKELIESLLTSILGMGRGAGIHIIAATQRGSAVQLSTEVRAGLLGKLSFQIVNPQSQSMAGVKGTDKLKEGEFKTVNMGHENKILKGFYVDRVKEWEVYKQLKRVLIEGKEPILFEEEKKEEIIIESKKISKFSKFKYNLEIKIENLKFKLSKIQNEIIKFFDSLFDPIYKVRDFFSKTETVKKPKPVVVEEKPVDNKILKTDMSVLELIDEFKELADEPTNNEKQDKESISPEVKEEKKRELLNIIQEKVGEDLKLPPEHELVAIMDVKPWVIKDLRKELLKEGYLEKPNGRIFTLKPDYVK